MFRNPDPTMLIATRNAHKVEEIRAILQLPITTLKIRVVRARAMLREIIESQGLTASGIRQMP